MRWLRISAVSGGALLCAGAGACSGSAPSVGGVSSPTDDAGATPSTQTADAWSNEGAGVGLNANVADAPSDTGAITAIDAGSAPIVRCPAGSDCTPGQVTDAGVGCPTLWTDGGQPIQLYGVPCPIQLPPPGACASFPTSAKPYGPPLGAPYPYDYATASSRADAGPLGCHSGPTSPWEKYYDTSTAFSRYDPVCSWMLPYGQLGDRSAADMCERQCVISGFSYPVPCGTRATGACPTFAPVTCFQAAGFEQCVELAIGAMGQSAGPYLAYCATLYGITL